MLFTVETVKKIGILYIFRTIIYMFGALSTIFQMLNILKIKTKSHFYHPKLRKQYMLKL